MQMLARPAATVSELLQSAVWDIWCCVVKREVATAEADPPSSEAVKGSFCGCRNNAHQLHKEHTCCLLATSLLF